MTALFDITFLNCDHVAECRAWIDRCFDYYVLDFAESGSPQFQVDAGPAQQLCGPVAWLTFPGPRFRFGIPPHAERCWNHRYVAFSGPFAERLLKQGVFNTACPVVQIADPSRFIAAFTDLQHYLQYPLWGADRAALMLEGLLLQLHEQRLRSRSEQMDARLRELVRRIREAPSKTWNFEKEAEGMRLSLSHFRRLFHAGMNQPPTRFVIECRMRYAATLLVERDDTIAEIAQACGYDDVYHFSKLFKKTRGISPGQYRKSHRQYRSV